MRIIEDDQTTPSTVQNYEGISSENILMNFICDILHPDDGESPLDDAQYELFQQGVEVLTFEREVTAPLAVRQALLLVIDAINLSGIFPIDQFSELRARLVDWAE